MNRVSRQSSFRAAGVCLLALGVGGIVGCSVAGNVATTAVEGTKKVGTWVKDNTVGRVIKPNDPGQNAVVDGGTAPAPLPDGGVDPNAGIATGGIADVRNPRNGNGGRGPAGVGGIGVGKIDLGTIIADTVNDTVLDTFVAKYKPNPAAPAADEWQKLDDAKAQRQVFNFVASSFRVDSPDGRKVRARVAPNFMAFLRSEDGEKEEYERLAGAADVPDDALRQLAGAIAADLRKKMTAPADGDLLVLVLDDDATEVAAAAGREAVAAGHAAAPGNARPANGGGPAAPGGVAVAPNARRVGHMRPNLDRRLTRNRRAAVGVDLSVGSLLSQVVQASQAQPGQPAVGRAGSHAPQARPMTPVAPPDPAAVRQRATEMHRTLLAYLRQELVDAGLKDKSWVLLTGSYEDAVADLEACRANPKLWVDIAGEAAPNSQPKQYSADRMYAIEVTAIRRGRTAEQIKGHEMTVEVGFNCRRVSDGKSAGNLLDKPVAYDCVFHPARQEFITKATDDKLKEAKAKGQARAGGSVSGS